MTPKQRRDGNSKPTLTPHQQMVAERAQLLSAAHELQRLAPWGWMGDETAFGVHARDRAEPDWVCVLGGGGNMFGLAVHVGWAGFDLIGLIASELIDADDVTATQDSYLLAFEPKSELSPAERSEIDGCGLKFDAAIGWPVFERHEPGSFRPRLTLEEVRHLRVVVEQALDVSRRVRDEALDLHVSDETRAFVRTESISADDAPESGDDTTRWTDEVVEIPPPTTFEVPPVDEAVLSSLRAKPLNDGACIQVDTFPAADARVRDGVTVIPFSILIVDLATEVPLDWESVPATGRFDRCRSRLALWMSRQDRIPRRIQVLRPELAGWLDRLCEPLGVEVVVVDDIPELERVRESFDEAVDVR